jgi:hypothetical protein
MRLDLKAIEASEDGMVIPDTHRHSTEVTVAGVTYARAFEIINGFTFQTEDLGHPGYTVRLSGSNNNLFEEGIIITNHNSVIGQNSAGLVVVSGTGGETAEDIWDYALEGTYTAKQILQVLVAVAAGKTVIQDLGGGDGLVKFRDLGDSLNRIEADMTGSTRTGVTLVL